MGAYKIIGRWEGGSFRPVLRSKTKAKQTCPFRGTSNSEATPGDHELKSFTPLLPISDQKVITKVPPALYLLQIQFTTRAAKEWMVEACCRQDHLYFHPVETQLNGIEKMASSSLCLVIHPPTSAPTHPLVQTIDTRPNFHLESPQLESLETHFYFLHLQIGKEGRKWSEQIHTPHCT